nr:juvenile hormone esterase [Diatraea saccharalis]
MAAVTATALIATLAVIARASASSVPDLSTCEVAARTDAGWVCGTRRRAVAGKEYASFLAVPYAKQPLGELRFQELLPAEPWYDVRNATQEGPVCPQTDVFYNQFQTNKGGMSEACIHANVHVPIEALPDPYQRPKVNAAAPGLPVLVFIHGGGFAFGSGDPDLYGPEYLVSKGVIVITFNYRLNVFGFLSLNTTQVPGNMGLRDGLSLLRWVRTNARAFGGDPRSVTLGGQSAGAVMAHMLTLSPAAHSLIHRTLLMSGTAFSGFISTSPMFATTINGLFLPMLGIDPALPAEDIHHRLIATPIDAIMAANKKLLDIFGLTTFVPVVESPLSGIQAVLDNDPEVLVDSGQDSRVPLLIGFTDNECESSQQRFREFNIIEQLQKSPNLAVSLRLTFKAGEKLPMITEAINARYFNGTIELDDFIRLCTDQYYKYPAMKLAKKRSSALAPTFLYRFSFGGSPSIWKVVRRTQYSGAGHVEDLTYMFRTSQLGPLADDELSTHDDNAIIREKMTDTVVNFMRYGHPLPNPGLSRRWSPVRMPLHYQAIADPRHIHSALPTPHESDALAFFNHLDCIVQQNQTNATL